MNSLLKAMAGDLNIHLSTRVEHVVAKDKSWQLLDEQQQHLGEFDWVISSATPVALCPQC